MRTLWCCFERRHDAAHHDAGTAPRAGSSTFTSWKRRASAGSFSKYFLYSHHVVAAIVRSSPRASAGLSRLAASFWPACAAGADHRVRLVDEEDDRRRRVLHLLDQPLEPVLELALDAGAGLQQREIERAHVTFSQRRRHVALPRCAARTLRRRPSCRRRPRRRGSGCSAGGASGCRPSGGSRSRGRAPGRSCPACARLGQVDRELVEIGRLAAGRGAAAARRAACRRARAPLAVSSADAGDDRREILLQRLGRDLRRARGSSSFTSRASSSFATQREDAVCPVRTCAAP